MSGRIHGFLGVYYTSSEFRRNSKFISESLRESKRIIDERELPAKPVSKVIQYESRPSISETGKDIWNDEVIRAVNWVYSINWVGLGHKMEDKLVGKKQ